MSDTAGKAKQQRNEILIARTAHSAGSANNDLGKSAGICRCQKKALRIFSGALLCRAEDALVSFNKVRIACADHPLRKHEAVHVNRDPAAIHEHEVRDADHPETDRPESSKESLLGN